MAGNKRTEELGKNIRDSFARWNYIYQNGAGDPFWEDGVNLELVRNHIIYDKRRCEEELLPEQYPPEYHMELPPVVDRLYMARVDEIKEHAAHSLEVYIGDANYQYLKENLHRLTEKQKDAIHVSNVLRYVTGLKDSINGDRLVEMRRHEKPEIYQESFRECREWMEAILGAEKVLPQGQLSLSDLFEM